MRGKVSQNPSSFVTPKVYKQRICTRKYIKHRCSDSHQQGHTKPHRQRASGQQKAKLLSHPCNYQCLWERIRSKRLFRTPITDLQEKHTNTFTRARFCHFTITWAMGVPGDREALTALWKAPVELQSPRNKHKRFSSSFSCPHKSQREVL